MECRIMNKDIVNLQSDNKNDNSNNSKNKNNLNKNSVNLGKNDNLSNLDKKMINVEVILIFNVNTISDVVSLLSPMEKDNYSVVSIKKLDNYDNKEYKK